MALRQLSLSLSSVRDATRTELDQIITSLVSAIPNLGIELKLMSETATSLQSRVQALHNQTATKDAAVDVTLARSQPLSKAKSGLIEARHALREAQAWSTLESQVTILTNEERWQEAVDRVAKAADSLRLFSGSAKSNQERSELLQHPDAEDTGSAHHNLAPSHRSSRCGSSGANGQSTRADARWSLDLLRNLHQNAIASLALQMVANRFRDQRQASSSATHLALWRSARPARRGARRIDLTLHRPQQSRSASHSRYPRPT